VDYTNYEDMRYAIKKLDDTEFQNAFSRAYVRVREYDSKRDDDRSPSRERSRSRGKSRSRSRSRSRGRSRSRSKSPKPKSSRHSRSRSRSRSASRSCSPPKPRSLSRYRYGYKQQTWGMDIRILRGDMFQLPATLFGCGDLHQDPHLHCLLVRGVVKAPRSAV
jgi:hypothetical protein